MKKLVLSTILLSLTGCMMSPMREITQGVKIDTNKFSEVVACETNKTDLIGLFGAPMQEGRQSGYSTLSWSYVRASFSGPRESQYVIAFLNNDSNIVDYAINPVGLVQVTDNCK